MELSAQPEPCVLLTGMGGVLGAGLARGRMAGGPRVIVAGRFRPLAWQDAQFVEVDLRVPGSMRRLIEQLQPQAVLHAAAVAHIDRCEQDPELAYRLHAGVIEEGVAALAVIGGRWITISTDQVFDGQADRYAEQAQPNPIHTYGRSKAEGEEVSLAGGGIVVRLPLLLGPAVLGRLDRMGADQILVTAARRGDVWELFEDEWRVPVNASDLAAPLGALLDPVRSPQAEGVYHLASADAIDRYTLGERACLLADIPFPHQRARLADWSGPSRPPRLVLSCERARRELGYLAPDLRQSLAHSAAAALAQVYGQEI